MLKIVNASKSKAKNAQHAQFVTDILAAIPKAIAEQYGFHLQYSAFALAGNNELLCFQPDRAYLDTPDVAEADDFRDDLFYFYKKLAQIYVDFYPDEEKKKAARTVAFAFDGAQVAAEADYSSETSLLTDLVEKLRTEPYASALTTLGIEEAPDEIEAANQAFHEIFKKRSTEVRERALSMNMRSLRPKTDEAFNALIEAINVLYAANEMVAKDEQTRTDLTKVINDVNDVMISFRRSIGSGSSSSGGDEPTPEPTPVTPEITAVYQKEEGDPENPHRIERGKQTGMKYQGFTLKGQDGTLEHVIGLVNDQDYIEWINPETITNVTETGCEFTMVPDLTEGQYKVRIETYDGGSPLVIEYPEPITLW